MTQTPRIEERNGLPFLIIGNAGTYPLYPVFFRDLKKVIEEYEAGKGESINTHAWNGLLMADDQIKEQIGAPATCLIKKAESAFKTGQYKTVSVWECIASFGDEREIIADEEEQPEEEQSTQTKLF